MDLTDSAATARDDRPIPGRLVPYWEQGWEGRIEYAFAPDGREAPLIWLTGGQHLKIFEPDGRTLWEGTIELVSRRRWFIFVEQHDLPVGIWSNLKQRGLSYATWIGWFWHDPPLRGELTLDPPSRRDG